MKRFLLTIVLLVLFTHAAQTAQLDMRRYNSALDTLTKFLGYTPPHPALVIIAKGDTTNMQQHQALVLQPDENFKDGTALANAKKWAADPQFQSLAQGSMTPQLREWVDCKIEESDPVAMAVKAEQQRLQAEEQRLEAERQAVEAARVLEQERQAAEAEAASATADGNSTQDGESSDESSRGAGSLSVLSIRSPGGPSEESQTPESTPLRPTRSGVETPSLLNADGTRVKGPSPFANAAARAKPTWDARRSSAGGGADTSRSYGSETPSKDDAVAPESMRTAQIYSRLISSGMLPAAAMELAPQVAARSGALIMEDMVKDVPSKTPRTPGLPPLPRPPEARKVDRPVDPEAALTAQIFSSLIASGTPVQSAMESSILAARAALGGPTPLSATGAGIPPADFVPGLAGLSPLPAAAASAGEDPTDFLAIAGLSPTSPSGRIRPPLDASGRP